MDFKQLRSFVAVADCGSFTQAASMLYASQPTVSAHIRQLEEELHARLFLRTTKSLSITPRGRELYAYAAQILSLQDRLLSTWVQDEAAIRLGASTIPASCILPEVLPAFRAQHPEAVFSIGQSNSAGVLAGLRAGRFELGLTGMEEREGELVFSPFFSDRMALLLPNTPHYRALLAANTPPGEILRTEPLLLRAAGSGSRKCVDAYFKEVGLAPAQLHIAALLDDQLSILRLVSAGLGVSILSGKAAQEACAQGAVLAHPLCAASAARRLYLVWRKADAPRAQTLAFVEFLRNFYAQRKGE